MNSQNNPKPKKPKAQGKKKIDKNKQPAVKSYFFGQGYVDLFKIIKKHGKITLILQQT